MFAAGAGLPVQDYGTYTGSTDILIRGMTKRQLITDCWETNKTFFYMDGGYFGN